MTKLIAFLLCVFFTNIVNATPKVKTDLTILKKSFSTITNTKASASEICLARNLYYEARGNLDEQLLVGIVTLNRAKTKNICNVISQRHQFSWYSKFKKSKVRDINAWHTALRASKALIHHKGQIKSSLTFFHSKRIKPNWSKHMQVAYRSNGHIYY